ncbi:RDD family protein [Microbacterium rhizosphaerae]|uniref:RDD family protein n=1 Tax=Microbacterium rhizosphaerae TaxID=1678237 RepID=A0ABZ0SUB2_9MICO|nr:RDD family protein [Microbacterium rhizosphaerae]WPR90847.1 RDD family protein [Microbacterium rhizosphaerae]
MPAPVAIAQDEILTGEAVALDVQPIGFFLRALGLAIDMVVSIAVLVLFTWAASWMQSIGLLDASTARILLLAVVALVTVVVPTTVETLSHGRSLGKLAVGGRIVRSDGGAAGFRHAFIRALVGVFEIWMTLGVVAAVTGAFTPRSQRLGDLTAGTYSERTRTPKLPAPGAGLPAGLEPWAATADVARLPDALARRCAQFVRQADRMEPAARARLSASLAAEAVRFTSPVPPVDAETLVRAVVAVRRAREQRALELEGVRVEELLKGVRQ